MMEKFSHTPGREIAKDRSDWLLDAIAGATQDRRFLRGDPAYDEVVGEVILLNAEKAICVALDRAAAPELLEALQRMLAWGIEAQKQIDPDWSGEFFDDSDFGVASRAIAKAMGE